MLCIPIIFSLSIILLLVYILYFTNQWRKLFHHLRLHIYFSISHAKRHRRQGRHIEILYTPIPIPAFGNILCLDFRNDISQLAPISPSLLKVVSWNIEMGYRLDDVILELKRIAPDVLLLQKADLFDNGRFYSFHTVREIARALGFSAAFAGHHPYISHPGRGIWGNAILSHFNIKKKHFLPLKCNGPYERSALIAEVKTGIGVVDFCSVHLEACCGIEERVKQLRSVIAQLLRRQEVEIKPVVTGGDLNTICNGLVRLSPVHCTDRLRFMTIGMTEAEWWDKNFFSNLPFSDPFCKRKDATFKNLFTAAKLDWILVKDLVVVRKEIGTGTQSDHKWISCTITKY